MGVYSCPVWDPGSHILKVVARLLESRRGVVLSIFEPVLRVVANPRAVPG